MPSCITPALIESIKDNEGFVSHGYLDSLGFLTIGFGCLIDQRKGGGITIDEAELLLTNRVIRIAQQLQRRAPCWNNLSPSQKEALIELAYQIGVDGCLNFKNTWEALCDGDEKKAYTEALDSKWAKQTPARAMRVAEKLRH